MIPIKDNIPTDRFPFVTVALILINAIVYLIAVAHGGSIISGPDSQEILKYGAIPYSLTHGGRHCAEFAQQTASGVQPVGIFCSGQRLPDGTIAVVGSQGTIQAWETVFSSMFMHASILHIGGNMLFLWIFGNSVEDSIGSLRYLCFYLLGGIAALALQVAIAPNSSAPTVGASGAIAAVLGGYVVLYPGARVLTLVFIILLFTVIELPALLMLGIWFLEQAAFAAAGLTHPAGGSGGVAYFAHIGGFLFGCAVIRPLVSNRKQVPPPRPVY